MEPESAPLRHPRPFSFLMDESNSTAGQEWCLRVHLRGHVVKENVPALAGCVVEIARSSARMISIDFRRVFAVDDEALRAFQAVLLPYSVDGRCISYVGLSPTLKDWLSLNQCPFLNTRVTLAPL